MDYSVDMRDLGKKSSIIREIFEYGKARKQEIGADRVFDFSIGNPSIPAPEKVEKILNELLKENPVKLHGYTAAAGDPIVRARIADLLNRDYEAGAIADYIYMTCGAAASLTISLTAILKKGEEVLVPSPYFPEYKVFTERAGGKLVPVPCGTDFQLDLAAIKSSINESTRAIIINSPNNPTGAVFSEETLRELSAILTAFERKWNKTIYLIADEPYRKLIWSDQKPAFLPRLYADTLVCYSYSKVLSLPGERIGYIYVSPLMRNSSDVYAAICGAGRALGYVCAPSMMQYLVAECGDETADLSVYRENRDLLMRELSRIGYDFVSPDGAFYLFMRALEPDAYAFMERAKRYELLLVPSDDFGCPGYVRIAYCVTPYQIKQSIPAFEALYRYYKG